MQSKRLLILTVLILPPVGLVLLWFRPVGVLRKMAGTVAILVLSFVYLYALFGMRIELGGTGMVPIVTFGEGGDHYATLEQSRADDGAAVGAAVAAKPAPRDPMPTLAATLTIDGPDEDFEEIGTNYWTRYRGPAMDGHYRQTPILTDWPKGGLERLFRRPIGDGYGSFAVGNGLAYTIEQRRNDEVVAAYEFRTGKEVWTHTWSARFAETMGGDGPRSTPAFDEGRVYALGATGELRCLDARTGDLVWRTNILEDANASNIDWGMAASPLVIDDKVIVNPGGQEASVVAYNKNNGEIVWKSLSDQAGYTAPMFAVLAGVPQLVVVTGQRAVGLSVEDGDLFWEYPWVTQYGVNAAQPLLLDSDRLLISAGYGHGSAVVQIVRDGGRLSAREIWMNDRMKNKFSSPVLYDGFVYGLDEGIMVCIDPANGDRMWKGGRYGHGQMILASGHLVVVTEKGQLVLVEASPEELLEKAKFSAIKGKTWNNLAVDGGVLLVRNGAEMAGFLVGG